MFVTVFSGIALFGSIFEFCLRLTIILIEMNRFFACRRLFSLGVLVVSAAGWAACSSSETNEAYDKYYGKGRAERAAEAVVSDSIKRAERKAARESEAAATPAPAAGEAVSLTPPAEISALLEKNTCSVCHKADERLVGPPWAEVAQKNYSTDEIISLVYEPKPEHWPGYPPMAPLAFVPKEDIVKIGTWINSLK